MENRTFSELVQDINDELSNWDSDGLARIAKEILGKDVEFKHFKDNEWIFEVKE